MKKNLQLFAILVLTVSFLACGGGGKESAASVAKKWCDLNSKVDMADGEAKDAAKAARKKYEDELDVKYKSDQAFMSEVEKETEKCENANRGN